MNRTVQKIIERFLLERAEAGVDITAHVPALRRDAASTIGYEPDALAFAAMVYATARKARRAAGMRGMRETRERRPA